jgi:hypothetical protein
MANETPSSDTPQFGKAEYASQPKAGVCMLCGRELGTVYYRVRNAIGCESCALQAKASGPANSHSAFVKAIMLGIGAAIIGMICYAAFTIMTGIEIGYVSLGVGFLVGKAMKLGSGGMGGRRYQIAAVLLTYAAVSLAAIPIAISQYAKESHPKTPVATTQTPSGDSGQMPAAQSSSPDSDVPKTNSPSFLTMIGSLVAIGLASPFLDLQGDFAHGAIGLLILFVGMRFAWQMTAGTETPSVLGPYANRVTSPAPAPPL